MNHITIKDIPATRTLEDTALRSIQGGWSFSFGAYSFSGSSRGGITRYTFSVRTRSGTYTRKCVSTHGGATGSSCKTTHTQ